MSMGTLLLAGLLWTAGAAPGDVFPINQRNFQIPIRLDPSSRSAIKELILYSSTDQGQTWNQVAVAPPDKASFLFYAPNDGVYWFSVCVVDQLGHRQPADISKLIPSQKILVDTQKPVLRIMSAERQDSDVVVTWEIQEEHPDLATLKLEYRTVDTAAAQWYTVPLTQATSGQARFRLNNAGPVTVRMRIQDTAGNFATASADVPARSTPAAAALEPTGRTGGFPAAPSSAGSSASGVGMDWETAHAGVPALPVSRTEVKSGPANSALVPSNDPLAGASNPRGDKRWLASSDDSAGPATPPGGAAETRARGSLPPICVIKDPQFSLDYEAANVGPSGLGRAELWISRDDGLTWEKFNEYKDLKSPISVDLSDRGEGVFGFTLILWSRAGLGKQPPVSGDLPQMRVELDMTPPVAKLAQPEQDPHDRDALVLIWNVYDRHLDSHPISLYWSESSAGPWHEIGAGLPNTGRHVWHLPPNPPFRVYLKLIARDTAGNTSEVVSHDPVLVDLNEPEVKFLGLAGASRQP